MSRSQYTHILSVDIGTTTIRSCLYEVQGCRLIYSYDEQVSTLRNGDRCEIDPQLISEQFIRVIEQGLSNAPDRHTVSLCFCTQRNSFLTYDRLTLTPTSKFICWNDKRSKKECDRKNRSLSLKLINLFGLIAFAISRQRRYKAAKALKFIGSMVSFRFMVALQEGKNRDLAPLGRVGYATLDTWLLMKLTRGEHFSSEASNVSATGLYDPFIEDYNRFVLSTVVRGFPLDKLVPIADSASTAAPHCIAHESIFGAPIPVHAILADQHAALFGTGGVNRGDTMISMGTGIFVQKNLGGAPHASMSGLYPLVAWKMNGKVTHLAEGQQHESATIMKDALKDKLFDDVAESSAIAASAPIDSRVYYMPRGGLQTPYNNDSVATHLRNDSGEALTKPAQVRARLSFIPYRITEIVDVMKKEIRHSEEEKNAAIRVCGGISQNDFIVQTIATLIDRPIERIVESSFAAARGVALMAGVALGEWSVEDVPKMVQVERTFTPKPEDRVALLKNFGEWQEMVKNLVKETC